MRSPRLARAALAAGAVLATSTLLEVGLRVRDAIEAGTGPTWAIYDEDLGYRLNPGYGDINAAGLRDRPLTPKDGRFRAVVLGDSVIYNGDDVDDTVVGRLRERLLARTDLLPLDIVNAGIKGYTTHQELLWLQKFGIGLEPDLVGVAFVLNDLHEVLHRFRVEDGRIVGQTYDFTPQAAASVPQPLVRLARRSRLATWIWRRAIVAGAGLEHRLQPGFAFDHRLDFHLAWRPGAWPPIEDRLRAMRDLGSARGFRLFVVAFPIADQYHPPYLERDRDYVLYPQRILGEICRHLDVPYLDLHPALGPELFDADGLHLGPAGRQRAASELADFLVSTGLLPAREAV